MNSEGELAMPGRTLSSKAGDSGSLRSPRIKPPSNIGKMQIRNAILADLDQITAIYNEILIGSTAIYSEDPVTVENRIAWWEDRRSKGYPLLVAVEGSTVAGFASFGDFRPFPGYLLTVEGTLHIHPSFRRQGLGNELLKELMILAKRAGKHTMIAAVDAENLASLRFLEGFGFEHGPSLREVGYKFGRFLDLVLLQYWITPPAGLPPSPLIS